MAGEVEEEGTQRTIHAGCGCVVIPKGPGDRLSLPANLLEGLDGCGDGNGLRLTPRSAWWWMQTRDRRARG